MWSDYEIDQYLKQNLTVERYEHSLEVKSTAEKLSVIYGADMEKAKIAGLIHDCAKNIKGEELISIVRNEGCTVDNVCIDYPDLLHGLAGAIIAQKTMGISDIDILSAIKYHTTGKANMTLLEKILYIADYIEPLRSFPGVDKLRDLAYKNLDKALLLSFDNTIKYVIDRGQLLHYQTIEARNYLIKQNVTTL